MVEYQVGCSDISQSNEAKVKVRMYATSEIGDMRRSLLVSAGSPDSSCCRESARRRKAMPDQMAKYPTARSVNPSGLRNTRLCASRLANSFEIGSVGATQNQTCFAPSRR